MLIETQSFVSALSEPNHIVCTICAQKYTIKLDRYLLVSEVDLREAPVYMYCTCMTVTLFLFSPQVHPSSSSLSSLSPLKPLAQFAPPTGSWPCDVCMVQNKPDLLKCAACGALKPVGRKKTDTTTAAAAGKVKFSLQQPQPMPQSQLQKSTSFSGSSGLQSSSGSKQPGGVASSSDLDAQQSGGLALIAKGGSDTKKTGSVMSLGAMFAPPKNNWECQSCLVLNEPEDAKCVACGAPSQSSSSASSSSASVSSAQAKPTTASLSLSSTGGLKLSSAAAPGLLAQVGGEGLGSTKGIETATTIARSDQKEAPPPPLQPPLSLSAKFAPKSNVWECKECYVPNKIEDAKCVACGSSRPAGMGTDDKSTSASASAMPSLSTGGFKLGTGSVFGSVQPPTGNWECETCLVSNKPTDDKCVACSAAKPGGQKESTATASKPGGQESKFGANGGLKLGTSGGLKLGDGGGGGLQLGSQGFKLGGGLQLGSQTTTSGGLKLGGGLQLGKPAQDSTSGGSGFKLGAGGGLQLGTALGSDIKQSFSATLQSSSSLSTSFHPSSSSTTTDNNNTKLPTISTTTTSTTTASSGSLGLTPLPKPSQGGLGMGGGGGGGQSMGGLIFGSGAVVSSISATGVNTSDGSKMGGGGGGLSLGQAGGMMGLGGSGVGLFGKERVRDVC